jgi:hypothetical protein
MFYYLYKITNIVNGKVYIGAHKTNNMDDNYFGSGKYLKRAIAKYGAVNFVKEILQKFDSEEEMFNAESVIVNDEFIRRKDTYNIKLGGFGGWDHIDRNRICEGVRRYYENGGESGMKGKHHSQETKMKYSKSNCGVNNPMYGKISAMKGKHHTEEAKKKIGKATSLKQKGVGNSQYGTMWIYNKETKQNKKIKRTDKIPIGWVKGRKI